VLLTELDFLDVRAGWWQPTVPVFMLIK